MYSPQRREPHHRFISPRDRLLEVYLLLLEHFLRICDLYVFPGCEKIMASAADIFHGIKAST